MNFIVSAQTATVNVYYHVLDELSKKLPVGKVGYWVAGRDYYEKFISDKPDFEHQFTVIKEWECLEEAHRLQKADLGYLRSFENLLDNTSLHAVLIGDRRIIGGKKVTFSQDYRPRYDYKTMLKILEVSLRKLSHLYDEINPSYTFSLYPAIYGDYLTYLISRSRGIAHFDLRLSRIKNYVMFGDGLFEPSEHILRRFENYQKKGASAETLKEAAAFLQMAQSSQIIYEGAVASTVSRNGES